MGRERGQENRGAGHGTERGPRCVEPCSSPCLHGAAPGVGSPWATPCGHTDPTAAAYLCLAARWRDTAPWARADSEGLRRRLRELELALEQEREDKRDMHQGEGADAGSHTLGCHQAHPSSPFGPFCSAPRRPGAGRARGEPPLAAEAPGRAASSSARARAAVSRGENLSQRFAVFATCKTPGSFSLSHARRRG